MSEVNSEVNTTTKQKPPFVVDGKRVVALESPALVPPEAADERPDEVVGEKANCPTLRAKFEPAVVNKLMGRLMKSYAGGSSTTTLFFQKTAEGVGMNLVHAWFGANMSVFSHSHPSFGDCLYYIVAGEAVMGARRLRPGAVFFVPKGKSYRVTAGPVGLEMLEFRVGSRDRNEALTRVDESSLESVERLIEVNEQNRGHWQQPQHIGDLAFLQATYDESAGKAE